MVPPNGRITPRKRRGRYALIMFLINWSGHHSSKLWGKVTPMKTLNTLKIFKSLFINSA